MKLNNINDSTKLSVRVPKALYESIQKELKRKKLNEATLPEEPKKDSGEMPLSFDISLAIERVEDAISDLEKVKQTLLRIEKENKNN